MIGIGAGIRRLVSGGRTQLEAEAKMHDTTWMIDFFYCSSGGGVIYPRPNQLIRLVHDGSPPHRHRPEPLQRLLGTCSRAGARDFERKLETHRVAGSCTTCRHVKPDLAADALDEVQNGFVWSFLGGSDWLGLGGFSYFLFLFPCFLSGSFSSRPPLFLQCTLAHVTVFGCLLVVVSPSGGLFVCLLRISSLAISSDRREV